MSTVGGPLLLRAHVSVVLLYPCLKIWQSIDAHSGYDLPAPLSPWSFVQFMDCAPAHDFHHSHCGGPSDTKVSGNYGGYFVFWDW